MEARGSVRVECVLVEREVERVEREVEREE